MKQAPIQNQDTDSSAQQNLEKQSNDVLPIIPNPNAIKAQDYINEDSLDAEHPQQLYPEQILEAQGDRADQANIEIDQEILEKIMHVRQNIAITNQERKFRESKQQEK